MVSQYYNNAPTSLKYLANGILGAMSTARGNYNAPNAMRLPQTTYNKQPNSITYTKRPGNLRRRKSFKKRVKQTEPAKHYAGTTPVSLVHNTGVTLIPTAGVVQGTSNSQREGDSIDLAALKIRGFYNSSSTAGAYTCRIIVGWTGEEYNNGTVLASGLGSSEVFLANTVTSLVPAGIINPKAFTVLYDTVIDVNSLIAASLDIESFAFTVPLNDTTFPYQADASVFGKQKNLAVYVVAAVAGGTTGTTAAGGITMTYDLVFKD